MNTHYTYYNVKMGIYQVKKCTNTINFDKFLSRMRYERIFN